MRKKYSALKKLKCIFAVLKKWRRVRVVEGARLESVYRGNSIASSNLAVSAKKMDDLLIIHFLYYLLNLPQCPSSLLLPACSWRKLHRSAQPNCLLM